MVRALAFRGVREFIPQPDSCDGSDNLDPLENAQTIDPYGDHYDDNCLPDGGGTCEYVPNHNEKKANNGLKWLIAGDDEWKDDISEIATASYYQVRITFEADIFTGLVPELSALAVAWQQ